jgi:hypothetical protein
MSASSVRIYYCARPKAWRLLALCGVLEGMIAAMNLLMLNPVGSLSMRRFALPGEVWDMSLLALVAGVCAIAAGFRGSGRDHSWLVSLHGLALGAFGLIGVSPLVKGPLSFRPVSLLFLIMASSIGTFALGTGQSLWMGTAERRLLSLAGALSIGFAFSFVAVGFGAVRLRAPHSYWIWMTSYFALCAILLLWLSVRQRGRSLLQSDPPGGLTPLRSPIHASGI